jgi:small subunit ribosomal protein S7
MDEKKNEEVQTEEVKPQVEEKVLEIAPETTSEPVPAKEVSEAPPVEALVIDIEAAAEEKPKKRSSKKEKKEEGPPKEQLMFGRYNVKDVIVEDPGLKMLINLDPAFVPHSSARHANKPFHKSKMSIVERLINGMMRTENYTGKKTKSYNVVLTAFEIIEEKTKENPIQVYVRALENTAPREEVTRLKFGGISVPKAVDTAPSRRLDLAIRNITTGSIKASHKNKKTIAQCLASELIAASKADLQSFAMSKKDEAERVAKSAH